MAKSQWERDRKESAKRCMREIIGEIVEKLPDETLCLIAAAPDLLAALDSLAMRTKAMNNRQHSGVEIEGWEWAGLNISTNKAFAAIAKAKGTTR